MYLQANRKREVNKLNALSYYITIFLNTVLCISITEKSIYISFFIYFISTFILLTRRKATEALIHRVGNYLDLLPEMPRYY